MTVKEYLNKCNAQSKNPFILGTLLDTNGEDANLYSVFGDTPYEVLTSREILPII